MTAKSKNIMDSKLLAGAVLVALSGHVPEVLIGPALADSATISISGSFIDGLTINDGLDLDFGTMVGTGTKGTATIFPTGGTSMSSGFFVAGQQVGSVLFNGAVKAPIDIKAIWVNTPIALTGKTPNGNITINTIFASGPFKLTSFTNPTAVVPSIALTAAGPPITVPIKVGASMTWDGLGSVPEGKFSTPLSFIITY